MNDPTPQTNEPDRNDLDDPDAPGNFVDDEDSDEIPEPNEPA